MQTYEKIKKTLSEEYSGRRLEEKYIRLMLNQEIYTDYCCIIRMLEEESVIRPVINSGLNGMTPPLYKKYIVNKTNESGEEYISRIQKLNSVFNIDGYLSNIKKFKEHVEILEKFDSYLKVNKNKLQIKISINERSFQIFQREKAIKEYKKGIHVLEFNTKLREALNYYLTPEPFIDFNINMESEGSKYRVLIIENKDTWYSMKRIAEKNSGLIGYNRVIYGEGKKIARKHDTLSDYCKAEVGDKNVEFYYWGDLDFEGIAIYETLKEVNSDINIKICKEYYIKMLELSDCINLPKMNINQKYTDGKSFYSYFREEETYKIKNILSRGEYIPQEIVDYSQLIR